MGAAWTAYILEDGSFDDSCVGWPQIEHITPPTTPVGSKKVRPSPFDIRQDFQFSARVFGNRAKARETYRRRMREVIARIRRQRQEREKVGLPGLDRAGDLNNDRIIAVEDLIERCSPSANAVAATTLIEAFHGSPINGSVTTDDSMAMAAKVLTMLRPQLTGLIAVHAGELIDNPERPLSEMSFYG